MNGRSIAATEGGRDARLSLAAAALLISTAAFAQGPPDKATMDRVTGRFKQELKAEGAFGVGRGVQQCYDTTRERVSQIRECMLYDAAAFRLNQGMQAQFTMRGYDVPVGPPYFTEKAYGLRLGYYGQIAFNLDDAATSAYIVQPSLEIVRRISR